MRRFLLYVIAVPIVLIVLATILVPLLIDESKFVDLAADTLNKRTGVLLEVNGDVDISLFPSAGLRLENIELSLPGEGQPDLSVQRLKIGIRWLPLLSGTIDISSLSLKGLLANIPPAQPKEKKTDTSQMSDSELDDFYQSRRQALQDAGNQREALAALVLPFALEVSELVLTESRIVLLGTAKESSTIVDIQRLEANDLNTAGRPVSINGTFNLPNINNKDSLLLSLQSNLNLNIDTNSLQLNKLEIHATGLTHEPLNFSSWGDIDLQQLSAELQVKLSSGQSLGEGSLRYAAFKSPQIDTKLHLNEFNPALLLLAGTDENPASTNSDKTVGSGDEPLSVDGLRKIDSNAAITIDHALIDGHEINALSLQLRIIDGIATVSDLKGKAHGGQLLASARLDAQHRELKIESSGSISDLDLSELLTAFEVNPVLKGKGSIDWQISSKGSTANNLRRRLTGPIKLRTEALVLEGIAIERILCQTAALINQETLSANLPADSAFNNFSADIQLKNGRALLSPLRAELTHLSLSGEGEIDLDSQSFDSNFAAKLSPTLSEVDQACRINKRYTAIEWPINCKGLLTEDAASWCKVDSAKILESLGRNEVQHKLQKEADKLVDKLLKRKKKNQ
ncbi:MAG: AsmA family protein [Parahaliea sp.]